MSALEIRSNGHIFIAATKDSPGANAPYEARTVLKEAGFWWHGGPCKPGCKACEFRVPKMWWTSDPAKAARLKAFCNEEAAKAIAPILVLKEKSAAVSSSLQVPCPDGLSYDPFQVAGVDFVMDAFLKYKGALIADEMGLGKTVQALGVMNLLASKKKSQACAVICPKSLVLNWRREAEKWTLDNGGISTWQIVTHEEWADGFMPDPERSLLIIWPYSQVNKFPKVCDLADLELNLLVFDEAHYIKNPEAQRTQECVPSFVKGKAVEGSGRIATQASHLLFLTGTPILNRPIELQTLLCAIDPSFSGFWFLKKFCNAHKDAQGKWDFSGSSNLEEMQGTLRTKFMVRRLKKDVYKDLPPKRHTLIPIPLNQAAKAVLKRAGPEESFESAVDKMGTAKPWGHPSQVRVELAITKVDIVVDFVKDLLQNTEKVIVFGWSVDAIQQITNELQEFGARCIIGDTSLEDRDAYVTDFQNNPDVRVIVGGYGPMGVGLTLTAAQTVVLAEPAWTPGEVNQAIDRAHRRGQLGMVNAYYLMYEGTLEARMMKLVISKQEIADKALDRPTEIKADTLLAEGVKLAQAFRDGPKKQLQGAPQMSTPEERSLIHRGLKYLASVCDGAKDQDGAGFDGLDSAFGKSLAAALSLSDKQAHHGKKLCLKYQRQLQAAGISVDSLKGI